MRLTTVAQIALPQGQLLSYSVQPSGPPGPPIPISFDQARHVGEGQRPGSWMAIAARLPSLPPRDRLAAAWLAVVRRHQTLQTVFGRDASGALELRGVPMGPGEWATHEVPAGRPVRDVLRAVFDSACAPFERPSHRLAIVIPDAPAPDPRPVLILGADHAHVDMWSFLVVLRDLLVSLDDLAAGRPPGGTLPPAAAFVEHTEALAARPPAPDAVHRRWDDILAAEGGVMPVFPLPLGDPVITADDTVQVRDVLDADQSAQFAALADARGVRMIALAVSVLTRVTLERSHVPLRAVFPVHSRDEDRWHDSVGWFITNAVIESGDPDPSACARAVREAIRLGSYPLGPILARYGGMPAGPGMFAISWLDVRRLPVSLPPGLDVEYVSAVVRSNGVMVWFIVNDAGLHLRARYPRTPEAHAHVGAWLDAVEAGLRAEVAAAPESGISAPRATTAPGAG